MVESDGPKPNSPINKRKKMPFGFSRMDFMSLGFMKSGLGTLTHKSPDFNIRWSKIKARERKTYETK